MEVREGVAADSIRVMPVATETAPALFNLGEFAGCSDRLWGLTWGAEDLSAALGASTNRDDDGQLEFTYKMARSLCLLPAVAAGIEPVDTVHTNFKDSDVLLRAPQST